MSLNPERKHRFSNSKEKALWQKGDRLFLSKITVVGVLIVVQLVLFIYAIWMLGGYRTYFEIGYTILSVVVVIYIINKKENPAYKLAWTILILLFPLFGGAFYLIVAGNRASAHFIRKIQAGIADSCKILTQEESVKGDLKAHSRSAAMQSEYIEKFGPYPVYQKTKVDYYAFGEDNYEPMLEALRSAKRFIFLEYFIIREGCFWNEVLAILEAKVKEGIDVRVLYDDFGCVATIPANYDRYLREKGIQCYSFNHFIPVLTLRLNNRDHRKIAVIDGYIGFTGGINIADEYINLTHPYGRWKDTGVKLVGAAVYSMTVMFLQLWEYVTGTVEDYTGYTALPEILDAIEDDGFVQPYSDSPLDQETLGGNIYLNMINRARKSILIITPYLVLNHEMITALALASKSGVNVKIIIPGIPDKKIVYSLTKTNARILMEEGVRIYEYVPGFTHAKVVLVDDEIAAVGTVNMDYRSLYLHFECGVWMYQTECMQEIRRDFDHTLTECRELSLFEYQNESWIKRMWQALLQLFAPLL